MPTAEENLPDAIRGVVDGIDRQIELIKAMSDQAERTAYAEALIEHLEFLLAQLEEMHEAAGHVRRPLGTSRT